MRWMRDADWIVPWLEVAIVALTIAYEIAKMFRPVPDKEV